MPPSPPEQTSTLNSLTPTALATGLGWVLGGPLGAVVAGGATTILQGRGSANANKLSGDRPLDNTSNSNSNYDAEISEAYLDAAADYLFRLNTETIATIKAYRDRAMVAIDPEIKIDRQIDPHQQQKLTDLERCSIDIRSSISTDLSS